MSNEIFASLNPAQAEAVQQVDGPLLILAGPGSGKTRVITHRIAHMLNLGIPAESILALTFTNKAADEMRSRIHKLAPGYQVWMGTFHRFCSQLLRRYANMVGLDSNFSIYDTSDSKAALRQALERTDIDLTHTKPESIAWSISHTKTNLISPEEYQAPRGSAMGRIMEKVYPAYQRRLLEANAVDFDDLLMHVALLLKRSPELRSTLDERFRYIMVDEYQDTNMAQYAIVRGLSLDHPNLAVTGDPDQSIYGWRGADIGNILEFQRHYPDAAIVKLESNYRSTPSILRIADALIANNRRRVKKSLTTENAEGPAVRLAVYPSQKEEANDIVDRIASSVARAERRYRDFAILYRTNALSRSLEHALREAQVPFQMINGVEFYQRKEIKDIFAYLHLINNSRNDVAFNRIVNVPARSIGQVSLKRLNQFADESGTSLMEAARTCGLNPKLKTAAVRIAKFVSLMDRLSELATRPVEEIIGHVVSESGYQEMLLQSTDPADEERLANIEELLTAAREYDEQNPGIGSLEGFLEETSLVNDVDQWEEESDRVTLMTLHAAKGLEFPSVFIIAMEQGLLPHERSLQDDSQLEEERRLLFVGITRAEQDLQLSYAKTRSFRGSISNKVPSMFLMELPRDEMQVDSYSNSFTGMQVRGGYASWDDSADEFDDHFDAGDDDWDTDMIDVSDDSDVSQVPSASLITAADMLESQSVPYDDSDMSQESMTEPNAPSKSKRNSKPIRRTDLADFKVGIRVMHPEYGLGKVIAMSGSGNGRSATVNFATGAGQVSFVLAYSDLKPLT